MTCIIYDGHKLVADKQATTGSGYKFKCNKVAVHKDGWLAGAGDAAYNQMILGLFERHGAKAFKKREFKEAWKSNIEHEYIYVSKDGEVYLYCSELPVKPQYRFAAIGNGVPYAVAAMMAGATAEEALEITHSCDAYVGREYDVYTIGDNPTNVREAHGHDPKLR